jgi:hypothetical protein
VNGGLTSEDATAAAMQMGSTGPGRRQFQHVDLWPELVDSIFQPANWLVADAPFHALIWNF